MGETSGSVVIPSGEVVAAVRHSVVPIDPPSELVPYVRPVHADGVIDDWLLTEDVLAFADVQIPATYIEWRQSWEHSWVLDPVASLMRLRSLAIKSDLAPMRQVIRSAFDASAFANDGAELDARIDARLALELHAALDTARDFVAERGHTGYGIVDATPGRCRIGMAMTWSPEDGPEVIAADEGAEVGFDPDHGLFVTVHGAPGRGRRQLRGVETVEIAGEAVTAASPDGTLSFDLQQGRVLSWMVPGATLWRVRQVPEVIVWARTFAGIAEAAERALLLRQPMRLTSRRLVDPPRSANFEST